MISHLIPFAAEIPAMAAVMGDGDDHQEFLHLLGDARFSTLRQRCLFFEKLKKQDLLPVPWTEPAVRQMLSKLQAAECTPNYIQQAWDTLKWFSSKFQTLDVESLQRLQSKKKYLQETLVSTASTPQRKAVVPSREVIWALEQGAAAVGAVSHLKGVQARDAIDAFIMGLAQESLLPGEIPGRGLPDPHVEQGLPGSDPQTGVQRLKPAVAERGVDQTRCCPGVGATLIVAFIQGIGRRRPLQTSTPGRNGQGFGTSIWTQGRR